MAKYLLLKHYRGAPDAGERRADGPVDARGDRRTTSSTCATSPPGWRRPASSSTGRRSSPEGTWVRYDGEGRPPVTDGPFAETKDLIAGWMVIDVDTYDRAVELAGELSAAPGAGGEPIHEWLEVRPFLAEPPTSRSDAVDPAVTRRCCGRSSPRVIGVLVRRGADFAAAEDAVQESARRGAAGVAGRAAARSEGLAGHGRVAQVHRRWPGPTRHAGAREERGRVPSPARAGRRASTTRCSSTSSARTRR